MLKRENIEESGFLTMAFHPPLASNFSEAVLHCMGVPIAVLSQNQLLFVQYCDLTLQPANNVSYDEATSIASTKGLHFLLH